MRIGLLNNNNNILFCLTRYLRDRGHDATLLVMNCEQVEFPHFDPSCDTFDLDFQRYTRRVAWGGMETFSSDDARVVARDLAPYDIIVGAGTAPAHLARIGRRLDVFMPWGYDIAWAPFRPGPFNRRSLRTLVEFPLWQRRGIRSARCVVGPYCTSLVDRPLERLGYKGERVYATTPQPYLPVYTEEAIERHRDRTHWYPIVRAFRERMDVVITGQSAHVWKSVNVVRFSKGNDKLIRAVAEVKRRRPSARVGIVFYEYGPDVPASKELAAELQIERELLWLPKSNRKDVMVNMGLTDFAVGETGELSWFSGGAIYEGLCAGKPLLSRRDDAEFASVYPDMYPMINVLGVQDVVDAIEGFLDSPEKYRDIGRRGQSWFREHVAGRAVSTIEDTILQLAGDR